MPRLRDLVVVSLEPWDGVWRRNQHLISGLLRRNDVLRVLFVTPPHDPLHALTRRRRPTWGRGLEPVPPGPGVPPARLWSLEPTKLLPRRIDPGGDRRWASQVRKAASTLDMDHPILWINDPVGAELLAQTNWRTIYDITDDWLMAPRGDRELARLRRLESQLIRACDEIVVCSPRLAEDKGHDRHVHLVPNAVDTASYRETHARPKDLPNGPTAVYVGTLHRDRLDVDLCLHVSERLHPAATLVFVGPSALDSVDEEQLTAAGAHILGSRNSDAIPAYLQHADVLVVPHVVTPFTESLDPIKAYEYSAAGRPVVATPVAGFRDMDGVVVQQLGSGFTEAVERLASPRLPTVENPSVPDWSDRVLAMERILLGLV